MPAVPLDAEDRRMLAAMLKFRNVVPDAGAEQERLDRLADAGYVVRISTGPRKVYALTVPGWALASAAPKEEDAW